MITQAVPLVKPPDSGKVKWGSKEIDLCFNQCMIMEDGKPIGYEPEVLNIFEHFVGPGDFVVDAGASIGFHTCFLAKLVGEEGVVVAFEPQMNSFKVLAEHVHISNKLNNVMCLREALWNKHVKGMKLCSQRDLGYSTFFEYYEPFAYEFVDARPLDDILVEENEHPRLIKIDCEGAEAEILEGAERILKKGVDCIVLELNYNIFQQLGITDERIRAYMNSLGYEMFLINYFNGDPPEFSRPMLVKPDINIILRGGFHINVMFSTQEKVNVRWPS